ncbi:MAG: sodium:glutamate symporter, partial [Spirochaetales bacterium]|nr:sodium:glutamate symporter [Spirochaetales bacterium]
MAFLLLTGLEYLLSFIGPTGEQLAATFWGLNFIFAAHIGLIMKKILKITDTQHIMDNLTLNRITGFTVDLMVTSAIAAISLVMISKYWIPILSISIIGAIFTAYTTIWFASRIFRDHRFLRTLLVFGVSTGTLSTGLALLRVVDPDFETPVATDYTYASGLTFVFAIPYILTVNMPLRTYMTGDYKWFWIAVLINIVYLLFSGVFFLKLTGKRAFTHKS